MMRCIFVCVIISSLFIGCSSKIIYEEVKIPISCNITPTPKPTYSDNLEIDLQNILIYDEMLQKDFKACIGK